MSERGMKPQASSPRAATGNPRLLIQTYAIWPGNSAYAACQSEVSSFADFPNAPSLELTPALYRHVAS